MIFLTVTAAWKARPEFQLISASEYMVSAGAIGATSMFSSLAGVAPTLMRTLYDICRTEKYFDARKPQENVAATAPGGQARRGDRGAEGRHARDGTRLRPASSAARQARREALRQAGGGTGRAAVHARRAARLVRRDAMLWCRVAAVAWAASLMSLCAEPCGCAELSQQGRAHRDVRAREHDRHPRAPGGERPAACARATRRRREPRRPRRGLRGQGGAGRLHDPVLRLVRLGLADFPEDVV